VCLCVYIYDDGGDDDGSGGVLSFFDGDTFLIDSKFIVSTAFLLATLSANKHFLWP
jgi:preprotein translocase subunit Sec61beta